MIPRMSKKKLASLRPVSERFWTKVDTSGGSDACWPWTAHRSPSGYGGFVDGHLHSRRAHRAAWMLTNGPIPEGMLVCHHCDNPPCCNPAHLFLGTPLDNMRDMVTKGRHIAHMSLRTHCNNGHEFTPENTHPRGARGRACRACWAVYRERKRIRKAKARAAA